MTDLNAAPDNILCFIRCNCNISKKRPCSTNSCSCKKHGLVCVSACGNCNEIDCENCENEVDIWTTSVTKKKIKIYLMYLMIEKPRTPKNIL